MHLTKARTCSSQGWDTTPQQSQCCVLHPLYHLPSSLHRADFQAPGDPFKRAHGCSEVCEDTDLSSCWTYVEAEPPNELYTLYQPISILKTNLHLSLSYIPMVYLWLVFQSINLWTCVLPLPPFNTFNITCLVVIYYNYSLPDYTVSQFTNLPLLPPSLYSSPTSLYNLLSGYNNSPNIVYQNDIHSHLPSYNLVFNSCSHPSCCNFHLSAITSTTVHLAGKHSPADDFMVVIAQSVPLMCPCKVLQMNVQSQQTRQHVAN